MIEGTYIFLNIKYLGEIRGYSNRLLILDNIDIKFRAMKNLLKIFIVISAIHCTNAKAQEWQWLKGIESSFIGDLDNLNVGTDAIGNTYVAGTYGELMTGGSLFIDNITHVGTNGKECYLVKYSPTGTLLWSKSFGSLMADEIEDIAVDASGNVYVSGIFFSDMTIEGTTFTNDKFDFFLLKFNGSGTLQWAQKGNNGVAQTGAIVNTKIALDANSNCYVIGSYTLSCNFGTGANATTINSLGELDNFLCKYNSSGVFQWVKSVGGIGNDHVQDIAVAADGSPIFAGDFGSTTNNSITVETTTLISAGNSDFYIAKYSNNGTYQWAKSAGGVQEDYIEKIAIDKNSNIYISGTFGGATGANASFGNINLSSAGLFDVFLVKLNMQGDFISGSSGGSSSSDGVLDLVCNPKNAMVYLCVQGTSNANYSGVVIPNNNTHTIRYSSNGTALSAIPLPVFRNAYISTWENSISFFGKYEIQITLGANSLSTLPGHSSNALFISRYNDVPLPPPAITSFFPNSGLAGSAVTIKGRDFVGVTAVSFNNVSTTFNVLNDSNIIAIVPSGANTGKIKIQMGATSITSSIDFTINTSSNLSYDWQWAKQYSAPSSISNIIDACADSYGNTINVGNYSGTLSIENSSITSSGDFDVFIIKFNSLGNVSYVKSFGGISTDNVNSVCSDNLGNIYITGDFSGSISFGNNTLTSFGGTDIYIVKLNSNGEVVWAKNAGGTNDDNGIDITYGPTGNIFLTGNIFGNASIGGISLTTFSAYIKTFIAMYDKDGNAIWANEATSTASNYGNSIASDFNGNSYVMGYFTNGMKFGVTEIFARVSNIDYFLVKYNSSGSLVWAKRIDGDIIANKKRAAGIVCDLSGNIFVAGCENINGIKQIAITKYNTNGNVDWKKTATSNGQNYAEDISLSLNGELFVTGQMTSTTSFGNVSLDIQNLFGTELCVFRFDNAGNALSAHQAINTNVNGEYGQTISVDASNNIYSSGSYGGTPTFGSTTLTTSGNLFHAKLGSTITGINNTTVEYISVSPNPSSIGYIYLSKYNNEEYAIVNILGQTEIKGVVSDHKIDVSSLSKGMYLLRIKNGTAKVIIE